MKTTLDSNTGVFNFVINGDLTSTTAGPLRQEISGLLDNPSGKAVPWKILRLDLSTAKMVDSVGLNFIVTVLKSVQTNGAKLEIVYGNPNVHRTFLFTRLDKHATLISGTPGK